MNMNPMEILKLKGTLDGFNARHPKLIHFFRDAGPKINTGSVLELSVTSPDGNKIRTNIRVTDEDKELFASLAQIVTNNRKDV